MNHHVRLEVVLILHPFLANIALKHPLGVGHCQVFSKEPLRGKLLVTLITGEGVAGCVQMVIQSLQTAVLVFTFRALEELLLSRLLVSQVGVGVEVELVEIFEQFGADVTAVFLVLM